MIVKVEVTPLLIVHRGAVGGVEMIETESGRMIETVVEVVIVVGVAWAVAKIIKGSASGHRSYKGYISLTSNVSLGTETQNLNCAD